MRLYSSQVYFVIITRFSFPFFTLTCERVLAFYARQKCLILSDLLAHRIRLSTVDCEWNEWNSWSTCSKTCGTGSRSRSRTKTDASHGVSECTGDAYENQSCSTDECPGM